MSYEGFQSGGGGSISFCDVNANKCQKQCLNTAKEPGALPPETSDESMLYDIYESHNLQNLINPPQKDPTTTAQPYNMASELGDFDPQAPMPWDYDNRQQDPQQTVWGSIHSDVSHMIYQKSYARAMFGSADPATFIENNNDNGQNMYRSNMFQTTVYGTAGTAEMTQVDAVGQFYLTVLVQRVLEDLGLSHNQERWQAIAAMRASSIPQITIVDRFGINISINDPRKGPTLSWKEAAARYDDKPAVSARVQASVNRIEGIISDSIPEREGNTLFRDANRLLTAEGEAELRRRRAQIEQLAIHEVEHGYSTYSGITRALELTSTVGMKSSEKKAVRAALGQEMHSIVRALDHVAERLLLKATARNMGKFVKGIFRLIAPLVLTDAVLIAACAEGEAAIAEAGAAAAVPTLGIGLLAAIGIETSYTLACNVAITAVNAINISLITWVPQLMSQLVDEQLSVCPPGYPGNMKEAFYKLPGGEAGWEIFSVIPLVGDISYMIMPYICWGTNTPDGKLLAGKLRVPIKPPYYYYDPTLSIYTATKTYAMTASPSNPTQLTNITSGIIVTDPKYTNHYLYTDPYNLYPFLVDFSHKVMLDKMAQYYYDMSRKNMRVNSDGTATFEYISKIYGVIASSELSCDIQCEISEITIDTLHGTKLCEKIVEVDVNGPAWHHDRRFYFYVDITQGDSLATDENQKCEEYLNYVQTPTPYNPHPKCSDYDAAHSSSGRSSADCSHMLWPDRPGTYSIYTATNTINFDLIREATASCNIKLLKSTPGLTPGKAGYVKIRDSWDPLYRMNDNMAKYVVTGCTYVDGTAPDVYDSKNQNVEGVQVGDTPVAVGPIGGKWHPPQIANLPGLTVTMNPTQPPSDTGCNTVRASFMRYGTTTRTDAGIQAAAAAEAAPNNIQLVPCPKALEWDRSFICNYQHREQATAGVDFSQVAKSMSVNFTDCPPGPDLVKCVVDANPGGFWTNMAVGSALGALGSYFNPGHVPVGAMIGGVFGTIGVQQYLTCLASDISVAEGTFVQNGMLRTSHQGAYIINHGPTIQFSPGYVPAIEIKDPGLNMQNCANRYAVRKFINIFTRQYPQYKLQKIFDISPRRVLPNAYEKPGGDATNMYPCCVFGVEYIDGANAVDKFVRMDMTLSKVGNVGIYQVATPTLVLDERLIPKIAPFTVASSTPKIPTLTVANIAPQNCSRTLDCSDPALQTRLFDQFNSAHYGVFIHYSTSSSGSSGSVQPSWTPAPTDGVNKCLFNVNIEKLKYDASNNVIPSTPPNVTPTLVTMYLEPVQDYRTDPTGCMYDLAYDDYPYNIWYKKIPTNFFDVPVPPTAINTKFQRNSPNCPAVADCSGVPLLDNLITQFNEKYSNKKINAVYRAFTPLVEGGQTVCDYDVEMIRTESDKQITLANQETVRMYLTPSNTDQCLYDLSKDDSDTPNSGLSLNTSQMTGALNASYIWSSNFLYGVRKNLYNYILPVLGLDVVNTIQKASVIAKDTSIVVFDDTTQIQQLQACPPLKCGDTYMLQKIINRYNFEAYPPYPTPDKYVSGPQYGAQERSILEFRRAGIASRTRCHVELIEAINTYDDFLYDAAPQNRRTYLRQYKFDINGDNCTNVSVAPLTLTDISKNHMDISGDPYGIDSDVSIVNPTGQVILDPNQGSQAAAVKPTYFTYKSPTVNCMDPAILAQVQAAYERRDVSSPNVAPAQPAFNRMVSVLEWFNPAPNICEYKMNIQHTYFDADYGYYYTLPQSTQISGARTVTFSQAVFGLADEASYIVAKWVPDWDYDIESGAVVKGKPVVDEYFYPDLTLKGNNFFRTPTSGVALNLPYLAGEGLSAVGSANPNGIDYSIQKRRFATSTSANPLYRFPQLDQSTWRSCRYTPDQQTTQAAATSSCAP